MISPDPCGRGFLFTPTRNNLHLNNSDIILVFMGKMIGYMVTWTTYGTWLQGDERGYVRQGKILPLNNIIRTANLKLQKNKTVTLTGEEKEVVRKAILAESVKINQTIRALAVCSNHVHLVAQPCNESIEEIVSRYKNIAMFALGKNGRKGRIWTRSFDKRFCFSEDDLIGKIEYVQKHNQ